MTINDKSRGKLDSPILVVGDSLPDNGNTKRNLNEILDRTHETYNSIILPIKYYLNEYLINYKGYKLPHDFKNKEDIFRYVNAIENINDKWGLDPQSSKGEEKLRVLKDEIFNNDQEIKHPIILCMGDFAYFAVRSLFERYKEHEPKIYVSKNSKKRYGIERLGKYFNEEINNYKSKSKDVLILPILHNSSNLKFEKTKEFIPEEKRSEYITYFEFIAECIGNILFDRFCDFLQEIKITSKNNFYIK